ncbi:MAG: Fe-S cluster assembly protein SufD [Rhodothermales bacterium]
MSDTLTAPETLESRFVRAFEVNEGVTLNGSNANIHGVRKAAMEAFQTLGFPKPRAEAWKYTNISRVLRGDFDLALSPTEHDLTADAIDALLVPGLDAHLVVLVNGRYDAELSRIGDLPEGVLLTGFAQASEQYADTVNAHFAKYAKYKGEAFAALNTAFAQDGYFLYVPKNVVLDTPVVVLHVLTGDQSLFVQPRSLFVTERFAQATVIELKQSTTDVPMFTNAVTEVYVGANAKTDHYQIQEEAASQHQVTYLEAYQARDSHFSTHTETFSGGTVRNNLGLLPNDENIETHLIGLFLCNGSMHVDNHTLVDHAKPNCMSNELYKGILDDQSVGVFNGKVFVRQDAQKINAYQTNKTIVLTEQAKMFSKPELEIYADDVQCSHGATTGQIEDEALFYLMARGIPAGRARALLLLAFARDVLDTVEVEPLQEYLDAKINARFDA